MDTLELQFPEDVREERIRQHRNISDTERWVSMAGGVGLAAYGLTRGRTQGWVLAGLGALLFRRGMRGHCDVYHLLGLNTAGTGEDTRQALGGSAGVPAGRRAVIPYVD